MSTPLIERASLARAILFLGDDDGGAVEALMIRRDVPMGCHPFPK
jgi:hypothetical protein